MAACGPNPAHSCLTLYLALKHPTFELKVSRAYFFNATIRLNPTTNIPIPDRPARFSFLSPDWKWSWWNFPRLGPTRRHPFNPQCTPHWLDRNSVRTALCLCFLLICHHLFYLLVYIKGALDNFNIIPTFFSKKIEISISSEAYACKMTTC